MSKQRNSRQIKRDAGGGRVAVALPKEFCLVVNGKRASAPGRMEPFVRRGDVIGVRMRKRTKRFVWNGAIQMRLELGKPREMVSVGLNR